MGVLFHGPGCRGKCPAKLGWIDFVREVLQQTAQSWSNDAIVATTAHAGGAALDGARAVGRGIVLPGWRDGLARVLEELADRDG